ncbi:hypothetical protein ACKVMT_02715 [Halobacteriales archaeon Cl-PHB]
MTSHDYRDLDGESFRALADDVRLELLGFMAEAEADVFELEILADRLADRVDGLTARDFGVRLHHVHLPLLADLGALEYDPRSRTVRFDPRAELAAMLDRVLVE